MKATQLPLFDDRALRQLEQLDAENAGLRERVVHAKTAYRKLRDERDTLQKQVTQLARQVTHLQQDNRRLQTTLELYKELADVHWDRRPRAQPTLTREEVRQLILMAHPDKWSQGQPATTLAHELTVVLNSWRKRLEVQP